MNRRHDNLMLLVAFIFGLAAIGGTVHWLNDGSITIRPGQRRGGVVQPNRSETVSGQIPGDHLLYYPVCAAWGLLGAAMVILSTLAFFRRDLILLRLTAFTAPVLLLLAFLTVGLSILVKPS